VAETQGLKELQPAAVVEERNHQAVVWMVRHPITRLGSCYRAGITNYNTWEDFVDAVLEGEQNRHWGPQVPQVTYAGVFLPTRVRRFERLANHTKGLPHLNASPKMELNYAYRRAELDNLYIEDLDKWETVVKTTA